MEENATDFTGLGKLADSELAKRIYSDGLQRTTSETGQLLGELSKTTRMVLQPLLTALQGASSRLDDWVRDAVNGIPEEQRIEANPALLRKTVQAIATEATDSSMRENYVKLLASLMDRERHLEVHPAFPTLLQELSPLDATLLQITPTAPDVALPDGLEWPPYHFHSGLVAAWETWVEGGQSIGRYRFFSQITKRKPEAIGKSSFTGKTDDHAGFLEFVLPQEALFRDKGLAWQNLKRLGLAKEHRDQDRNGNLLTVYHRDPVALKQMESLSKNPDCVFGYHMYFRTELGRAFAKSCVPTYLGETHWHPIDGANT